MTSVQGRKHREKISHQLVLIQGMTQLLSDKNTFLEDRTTPPFLLFMLFCEIKQAFIDWKLIRILKINFVLKAQF